MIRKSISESFELANGTEIYVQASMQDRINISFDGIGTSTQHTMTLDEAQKMVNILTLVIVEALTEEK